MTVYDVLIIWAFAGMLTLAFRSFDNVAVTVRNRIVVAVIGGPFVWAIVIIIWLLWWPEKGE